VRRRLVGLAENEESHRRTGYFCRPRRAPGRRCRSANLFQSRKNSVACSLRKTNRPLPSDLPDKQAGDFDDSVAWAANERALPPSRTKPLLALGSRGQEPVTGVKSVVSSTMRARADVHTRARPRGCDGPGSRSRPSRAQLEGVDRWRHTVCSALEDIRVGSKTGRRLLPTTAVGVLRTRGFTSSGSLSCRRSMLGLDRAAEAMRQAGS
jgi:hypothetical protein